MTRRLGFALMLTMAILAGLLQWRGLLVTKRIAPKVVSQVSYTKSDGTIVHATTMDSRPSVTRWVLIIPIGTVFIGGAAIAAFSKRW